MKENVSGRHKLLQCLCIKQKEKISIKLSKFLYYELSGKFIFCCYCLVIQSCSTFCDPMDCHSPGSSVHGISQARILEWVAISPSRGSSWPRDKTCISRTGLWILYH